MVMSVCVLCREKWSCFPFVCMLVTQNKLSHIRQNGRYYLNEKTIESNGKKRWNDLMLPIVNDVKNVFKKS